ncbi:hypothetical protein CMEL01_05277 [Colletotrichum melonis]|uniref:Uncharacterized protein n=1 Tax=Colletotrichum melonis TaxID=1209925 RepID=A0AAI9U896_9PEZI|nr:hypothetical protein CMEL01_05277 [Colletotrichum melonis]
MPHESPDQATQARVSGVHIRRSVVGSPHSHPTRAGPSSTLLRWRPRCRLELCDMSFLFPSLDRADVRKREEEVP